MVFCYLGLETRKVKGENREERCEREKARLKWGRRGEEHSGAGRGEEVTSDPVSQTKAKMKVERDPG